MKTYKESNAIKVIVAIGILIVFAASVVAVA